MKYINTSSFRFLIIVLSIIVNADFLFGQVTKVTLYPYLVTNISGLGNATAMVDEQDLSGDPLNGVNGVPLTIWQTSFSAVYPLSAYIDLGSEMAVKNIFIYDSYNMANLIIDYGTPDNWQNLFTEPLNGYKKWKRHDVSITTRYLKVTKTSPLVNFNEFIVYADNPILPPPNVTNLTPVFSNPTSVKLTWNDVTGNQSTGIFTGYDLRYSKTLINEANFSSCSSFQIPFNPNSGTSHEVTVTGIEKGTKYYFALKLTGEYSNSAISNISTIETPVFYNQIETRVILNPEMVFNESGFGIATNMVDEQSIAGDPLHGSGGAPTTHWFPGSQTSLYPASAYIDLGSIVYISKIYLRDINSNGNAIFEIGTPGNWTTIFTDPCLSYLKWNLHEVNAYTRYLRVTLTTREAKFSEIALYVYSSEVVEEKIVVDPSKMNNVANQGDPGRFVDEQEMAGDPLNSPGGNPTTTWQTSYSSSVVYPLFTELDLGKIYDLTHVFLRDANDYSDFTVWSGTPGNWELLFTDNLMGYLSWNQHDINVTTRFLRFGKSNPRSNVAEIVLYGYDRTPGEIDSIAPSKITDLIAQQDGEGKIELTWTSTGDDGLMGTNDYYLIKYSTELVTAANFLTSTSWALPPEPQISGTPQSLTINGLLPDTRYYFAIKSVDDALNFSEISNCADQTTQIVLGGEPYKFTLTPKMVINESAQGSAFLLVDEQALAGDPKAGQSGNPINKWDIGSTSWMYPGFALIDLGGNCLLSEIYLYDMTDAGEDSTSPVSIYYGSPFEWNLLFTDNLAGTNSWNQHDVNLETRYLRIKIHSPETRIGEIVVYGSRLEMPAEEPVAQAHPYPLMDQLIGANAFVNSPVGRMQAVGFIREYHNWSWCEGNTNTSYPGYPNNQNEFNVLGWNFDYYYEILKKSGLFVFPDIQGSVLWLTNFNQSKLSNKPVSEGEDPLLPASYAEHADHMFQYAARYGNTQVSPGLLKLASNQKVISGTALLNYYEDWNEQNKWWNSREGHFTPYEYSAMASADYDGHMGTMGPTFGVKNADPNAKLVMGGLAETNIEYIKAMKLWADYYRNGEFPADVINVHHYCHNGPNPQTTGTVGVSPEAGNLKGFMAEFADYRNKYYPGKEVWITEFGYDTHPASVLRSPEIGSFSQFEVQAQWLVRSYLVLAASGVDKAAMYMLADVNPASSTKFDNSGLISSAATGYVPKISWYYVYTMKNHLTGMRFQQEIPSGNPQVMIYRFKNDNENVGAYSLWCPTSNQTEVSGYELTLAEGETQVKLVELVNGSISGQETILEVINGKVTVNVSERPVFIIVAGDDYVFPEFHQEVKLELNPTMVTNETGLGVATNMVDEQTLSGDPLMGNNANPVTSWSPGFSATYPRSSYIDLGQEYDVSKIYLRDYSSSGNVTISAGEPGNWTSVFDDDLGRYKVWSGHVVNQKTRYIRVTLFSPSSTFSELILYVKE